MRATARVLIAIAAGVLGGCSSGPTMRGVIYDNYGVDSILLRPSAGVPKGSIYSANAYRFVPGATVVPGRVLAADHDNGRAAVWTLATARYCRHRQFRLDQTEVVKLPDVTVSYNLDASFGGAEPSPEEMAKAQFDFPTLSRNQLGRVKQIYIKFTNVRSYTASPDQITRAFTEMRRSAACRVMLRSARRVTIVKIIAADIAFDVVDKRGFVLSAGNFLRAAVQNNFRYRVRGTSQLFVAYASSAPATGVALAQAK